MKVGDVDVQMDMRSALNRLMDDVAGAGGREEDSIMTEDYRTMMNLSSSRMN
jgi:hypothetical protein